MRLVSINVNSLELYSIVLNWVLLSELMYDFVFVHFSGGSNCLFLELFVAV